jgi:hypothetical protein
MMKSDEVRSSGDDTLLNIEINEAWRKVTISSDALEGIPGLSPEAAAMLKPERRCDLVGQNMAFVFAAVRRKLLNQPNAQRIWLGGGDR